MDEAAVELLAEDVTEALQEAIDGESLEDAIAITETVASNVNAVLNGLRHDQRRKEEG